MVAKKMLAALVVLMLSVSVFAQKKEVYFGTRLGGGIGLSSATNRMKKEIKDDYDGKAKFRSGGGSFDVAPFVSIQLADKFALGTELLFTQFGMGGEKVTDDIKRENGEVYAQKGDGEYGQIGAVVIPVLAQVTLLERRLNIFAGPHFTINQKGNEVDIYDGKKLKAWGTWNDDELGEMGYKMPPVGLTFGAAFGFNAGQGKLFFDARYITDLGRVKHIYKNYVDSYFDEDAGEYIDVYEKIEEKHVRRAKLALSVGYEFGTGNR